MRASLRALFHLGLNILSACAIVFANKAVLTTYGFHFPVALTFIHTLFTCVGMECMALLGLFQRKVLTLQQVTPLAGAFVGYIVLCNISLQINPVALYQLMKIAVAPTVVLLEYLLSGKVPGKPVFCAVLVVCVGVGIATVAELHLSANYAGLLVGVAATLVTALYQVWVGTKQKELEVSSMQLLHQYTPIASIILGCMVPLLEPHGYPDYETGSLLAWTITTPAAVAIIISTILGFVVTLSTFLAIQSTSSLTYSVVGHVKTFVILAGSWFIFNEPMPIKKVLGLSVSMIGLVWYTHSKLLQFSNALTSDNTGGRLDVRVDFK